MASAGGSQEEKASQGPPWVAWLLLPIPPPPSPIKGNKRAEGREAIKHLPVPLQPPHPAVVKKETWG